MNHVTKAPLLESYHQAKLLLCDAISRTLLVRVRLIFFSSKNPVYTWNKAEKKINDIKKKVPLNLPHKK